MLGKIARKIFGSANDRFVKKQYKIVNQINALEPDFIKLSDEELKAKTVEFRERIKKGESLDDILPEAFATVREAAKRVMLLAHINCCAAGSACYRLLYTISVD